MRVEVWTLGPLPLPLLTQHTCFSCRFAVSFEVGVCLQLCAYLSILFWLHGFPFISVAFQTKPAIWARRPARLRQGCCVALDALGVLRDLETSTKNEFKSQGQGLDLPQPRSRTYWEAQEYVKSQPPVLADLGCGVNLGALDTDHSPSVLQTLSQVLPLKSVGCTSQIPHLGDESPP